MCTRAVVRSSLQHVRSQHVGPTNEDSARLVGEMRLTRAHHRGQQLVGQLLLVRRRPRDEEDHVDGHALETPVVVRVQQLPGGRQSFDRIDGREQNRPVTGQADAPELALPQRVRSELLLRRAHRRVRVEEVPGDLLEQRRVRRREAEVAKLHLGARP